MDEHFDNPEQHDNHNEDVTVIEDYNIDTSVDKIQANMTQFNSSNNTVHT